MTQLPLSLDTPPRHRARRTDPATSHAAAERSNAFAGSHVDKIVHALKLHGPSSPARLEWLTGLTLVQIDRRRQDGIKAGLFRVKTVDNIPLDMGGVAVIDGRCEVLEVC